MDLKILTSKKMVAVSSTWGWIPDVSDSRDNAFSIHDSPIADVSPVDCDNRKFFKEVSDQFNLPSCTANAGCDNLEAELIKALVDSGMSLEEAKAKIPDLSRMSTWYWGRSFMEPSRTSDANCGCFNRLIMEVFARFGASPEHLWPYDNVLLPPLNKPRAVVRPSITAQRAGIIYRTNKYYNIPCANKSQLILGIDKALSAGHNVVWGTMVGSNMTKYEGGTVTVPRDHLGRHAMVLCGKQKGLYWNRNSWSKFWGINGYCLIDPNYVTWNESSSFWVAVPEAVR